MTSGLRQEDFRMTGVQHDQGKGYQQPIIYKRVIQSGRVEIKNQYLHHKPYLTHVIITMNHPVPVLR